LTSEYFVGQALGLQAASQAALPFAGSPARNGEYKRVLAPELTFDVASRSWTVKTFFAKRTQFDH